PVKSHWKSPRFRVPFCVVPALTHAWPPLFRSGWISMRVVSCDGTSVTTSPHARGSEGSEAIRQAAAVARLKLCVRMRNKPGRDRMCLHMWPAQFYKMPTSARICTRSEEHTSELQSRFDLV